MRQIKDGGPVGGTWEHDQATGRPRHIPGATLRDHFAAQALTAVAWKTLEAAQGDGVEASHAVEVIAALSYALADAMIAARSKQEAAP